MERSSAFCDCLERERPHNSFQFFFTFLSARSPRMDSIGHYGLLLLGEKIWMWTKGSHLRELRVPCNSVRGLFSFFFFFFFSLSSGGRRMEPLRILYYEVASMTLPSNVPCPPI